MESALRSVYFVFMNSIEIFQLALQLQEPWYVFSVRFEEGLEGAKELHIDIDFEKGFEFEPEAKVHDRTKREWRHLNFFVQSKGFLRKGLLLENTPVTFIVRFHGLNRLMEK